MKRDQNLVQIKWKFQVASSAALSEHPRTILKADEVHICCEELNDSKEQFGVAQVATNGAWEDIKPAGKQGAKAEAHCIAIVKVRCERGELTKPLRQRAASAAAKTMKLTIVHSGLKTFMAKVDSLDEELKGSWIKMTDVRAVGKDQNSRLDSAPPVCLC